MAASLICSLLVLAAPAARALGTVPGIRAAGGLAQRAAQWQPADGAPAVTLPLGRGSTRELLTRQLRSRKMFKAPPAPPTRKGRSARTRSPKPVRQSHQKAQRNRRARGTGSSSKKVSAKPVSSKKSKSGSKPPAKPRKDASQIKEESLCAAHVVEKEVVRKKNAKAHVTAIQEVFTSACLKGSEINTEAFREVFMSADAFVFSQTISKAIVTCKSDSDDAYECATVTASAEAYARATAEAHAEAVAAAVNSCGCMTEAVSESISNESIYINLIAKAASAATATACIEGKGRVRASAYDKCSSKVYGRVFARAVAEAIVKGNCMNADAISRVLTEASGEFDTSSTCGLTASAIAAD